MLFQTPAFAVFLVMVVTLVCLARENGTRKNVLLAASYGFYMWWSPLFVLPLLVTTFIDFFVAKMIEGERQTRTRRFLLGFSLCANLGLLAYFKYFGFFVTNLAATSHAMGFDFAPPLLQVVLPVGISFYTFHTMSYTIDVYRGEIPACQSARDFALFITFFPVLVAGPILRARNFLPQLDPGRSYGGPPEGAGPSSVVRENESLPGAMCRRGIRVSLDSSTVLLFVRGLVKKVVVADNLSRFVEDVFHAPERWPSVVIWTATIAFAVQIYCDFSGYSDMARALARLFGLQLPMNFDRPYFASNPSEFWHRWHISLSSWLRDYLYVPLGGNRGGEWRTTRNLMVTMLLGGLWHGASWNFVLWGFLHGILLTVHHAWRRFRRPEWMTVVPESVRSIGAWMVTQYAILLTWIVFRVRDFSAMSIALRKFVLFDFDFALAHTGLASIFFTTTVLLAGAFLVLHAVSYRWGDLDERIANMPVPVAAAICLLIGFTLLLLWPSTAQPFIYFQF